jgi:lysyl-tRNA synthetase class 2
LKKRAAFFRAIGDFFLERGYLEVDTPSLATELIPESCLEVFKLEGASHRAPFYLIPSPEVYMKRVLAHYGRALGRGLFQICHSFRNYEAHGGVHSPEFTMLEYYSLDYDYRDSLSLTEELLDTLISRFKGPDELRPPFIRLTMNEAFQRYAGFDLLEALERGNLADEVEKLGLDSRDPLSGSPYDTTTLYTLALVDRVEASLPRDRPVALLDYPAAVPTLASLNPDGRTYQRWELYMRGVEISNCYTEETDPAKIQAFIQAEDQEKSATARVRHPPVQHFPGTQAEGNTKKVLPAESNNKCRLPPCSGNAVGLDRLCMVLCGKTHLDAVMPFPLEDA